MSQAEAGTDPRRRIPRTDALLADAAIAAASAHHPPAAVRAAVAAAQQRARAGEITPEQVPAAARAGVAALSRPSTTAVLNATGVVVHTNLGRAPLSQAARAAVDHAAGYVDVELDLASGRRSRARGRGAVEALLAACPAAEAACVVNNGASALLLAAAALAEGGEVAVSRGELIEIGAGFRLPELIGSARVDLHEIGATNRTHPADYAAAAARPQARAILKVHPSNYRVEGFTSAVDVAELHAIAAEHSVALIVDVGSGLLTADAALPEEPDVDSALRAGADVVIASGDKLLGGPQAGIVLGRAEAVARLKRHPLYRAVRMDKLRFAALEATVAAGEVPVTAYLHADAEKLRSRARRLADRMAAAGLAADVVAHDGRVGGGGAPGVALPGFAVRLPAALAAPLRTGSPAVLGRVHAGALLLDPRCVPEAADGELAAAVTRAASEIGAGRTEGKEG